MQELAEKVGAPYSAIFRWEKGQNKPSSKNLVKLKKLFAGEDVLDESSETRYLKNRIVDLEKQIEDQREIINVFKNALESIAKK